MDGGWHASESSQHCRLSLAQRFRWHCGRAYDWKRWLVCLQGRTVFGAGTRSVFPMLVWPNRACGRNATAASRTNTAKGETRVNQLGGLWRDTWWVWASFVVIALLLGFTGSSFLMLIPVLPARAVCLFCLQSVRRTKEMRSPIQPGW